MKIQGVSMWLQFAGVYRTLIWLPEDKPVDHSFFTLHSIVTGERESRGQLVYLPTGFTTTTFQISCGGNTATYVGNGTISRDPDAATYSIPVLYSDTGNLIGSCYGTRQVLMVNSHFGGVGVELFGINSWIPKFGVLTITLEDTSMERMAVVNAILTGQQRKYTDLDREITFYPTAVSASTISITCNTRMMRFTAKGVSPVTVSDGNNTVYRIDIDWYMGNFTDGGNATIVYTEAREDVLCDAATANLRNLYYDDEGITITGVSGEWLMDNPSYLYVFVNPFTIDEDIMHDNVMGENDCKGNSNQQCNGQGFATCSDLPSSDRECKCRSGYTGDAILTGIEEFNGCVRAL